MAYQSVGTAWPTGPSAQRIFLNFLVSPSSSNKAERVYTLNNPSVRRSNGPNPSGHRLLLATDRSCAKLKRSSVDRLYG